MKTTQLLTLLLLTPLVAEASSWLDGDRLTGDWKGVRTSQEDAGFKYFAYYSGIFAANVDGGNSTDSSYSGDLFLGMEIDLEKVWGWDDTKFVLSGIDRHGRSIDQAVGGQYSVMQNVGGQNAFLYNITLEKKFLDDTLSVKLGRMSATDDFVGSPYYGFSINNSVNGQIRAALFDGVMTSYPFPVWGGRVKYQPTDETYAMLGVFQLSDDMFNRNAQGVDFLFESGDGVSIFTQGGWNPQLAGRPAHFFAGMNLSFFDMDEFNSPDTRNQFARFYGHADYQVFAEAPDSKEGLVLFATLGYTPFQDVAIIPVQSTFGANYTGLFPGREHDNTVFFATYGKFSNDYAAQQAASGLAESDDEMVLEIGHRFQVTPASYIQPDIQYIIQPGGTGTIDNALVLGVQFGASF
ncbi:carbohydrate porin [bacterium]|nr:carbohydrate porin [bacterium]